MEDLIVIEEICQSEVVVSTIEAEEAFSTIEAEEAFSTIEAEDVSRKNIEKEKTFYTSPKVYKCKYCDLSFVTPCQLRCHILRHTGERPYACTLCEKTFTQAAHLKEHVRTVHFNERPFQCNKCCAVFSRGRACKRHEMMHLGNTPFSCETCTGKFRRRLDLDRHMRKFHNPKSKSLNNGVNCDTHKLTEGTPHTNCIKNSTENMLITSVKMIRQLSAHEKAKKVRSDRTKVYPCRFCTTVFCQRAHLVRHERMHLGEKPHKCKECSMAFRFAHNLKTHMMTHTGRRPYLCSTCGASFIRNYELRIHENIHKGIKPHGCNYCEKRFLRSGDLKVHERLHTGVRPYACSQCDRTFTSSSMLTQHLRGHTGEKYECSYCGSRFRQSHKLKVHVSKKHPGGTYSSKPKVKTEKIYTCCQCNLSFSDSYQLKEHESSHTDTFTLTTDIKMENSFCDTSLNAVPNSLSIGDNCKQNVATPLVTYCKPSDVYNDGKITVEYSQGASKETCDLSILKTEVETFSCSHCPAHFSEALQVLQHEQAKHGTLKHVCRICGKELPCIQSLRKHELGHDGVRPFACEKCGSVFHRRILLTRHKMSNCDNLQYRCGECGAKCASALSLAAHQRESCTFKTESGDRSPQNSGDAALTTTDLLDKKPYICARCDATFSTVGELKDHVREIHLTQNENTSPPSLELTNPLREQEGKKADVCRNEVTYAESVAPESTVTSSADVNDPIICDVNSTHDSNCIDVDVNEALKQHQWPCPGFNCNAEFSDLDSLRTHAETHGIKSLVVLVYPQD